jgi:hypothetical protein
VANFPINPGISSIFTDTTSGFRYKWTGTVWKSFTPSAGNDVKKLDDISSGFDNSTTTFALTLSAVAVIPVNAQSLTVSLGGVVQEPGTDYTVSGSNITFTTAPNSGLDFFAINRATATDIITKTGVLDNLLVSGMSTQSSIQATNLNVTGVITATSFVGNGSGLTGVASTDNIQTSTEATFLSGVKITGVTTASGGVVGNVTGELTGVAVTTGAYGLHATGIVTATGGAVVSGALTATTAIVGSAVSISAGALDGGRTVRILGENLNVLGIATAQDFDSLSDINFKENISTVHNALETVGQLRGVSFNWKESGEPSYGVIAQEMENVLPELVHGDDPKRVNYNGIIGVLIEAVKELSVEVKQLKTQDTK